MLTFVVADFGMKLAFIDDPSRTSAYSKRERAEPDDDDRRDGSEGDATRRASGTEWPRGSPPRRKSRSQISARIRRTRQISATLPSWRLSADLRDEQQHVGTRRFVGTHGLTSCSVV